MFQGEILSGYLDIKSNLIEQKNYKNYKISVLRAKRHLESHEKGWLP